MTDATQFKDFIKQYYRNMPNQVPYSMMKGTDPFTFSKTDWFDPVYLGQLQLEGLTRSHKASSALTKTTYQDQGDSFQVIASDITAGDAVLPILETSALHAEYDTPAITDHDKIYPAITKIDWINTDVAAALSGIQRSRNTPNLEQIRNYMSELFLDRLERMICGVYVDFEAGHAGSTEGYGVDAPATVSNIATVESIDRMITNYTESGNGTTYTSSATDGDVYWNTTGTGSSTDAQYDRSGNATNATVRLPDSAVEQAFNICDELDDLMAQCLVFAGDNPNYICMMSPKAYNKVKAENDPKALITDYTSATQTIGGITSTPGVVGGKVQLSAIRLSDITVPIVTVPYLMGTVQSSWLWKNSVFTTGGVGNIYLINQNAMEYRTLIPITYRSTPTEDALTTKHTLFTAGQLIAKNLKSHGALKYIAS
jgi:hypothetical protein